MMTDQHPYTAATEVALHPIVRPAAIAVSATFEENGEWVRRYERCPTRKNASDAIRDARGKGGFHIIVLVPTDKVFDRPND